MRDITVVWVCDRCGRRSAEMDLPWPPPPDWLDLLDPVTKDSVLFCPECGDQFANFVTGEPTDLPHDAEVLELRPDDTLPPLAEVAAHPSAVDWVDKADDWIERLRLSSILADAGFDLDDYRYMTTAQLQELVRRMEDRDDG